MADHNKTEKPTQRRKDKARKEGQVPRSRELPSALVLLSAALFLWWQGRNRSSQWAELFRNMLAMGATGDLGNGFTLLQMTGAAVIRWALPVALVAWVIALMSSMAQGGLVFAPQALAPNLSRFSPAGNIKKLFSPAGLSGMLKSLLPLGFLLYIFSTMLVRDWNQIGHASRLSPRVSLLWLADRSYEVFWKGGLVFLAWAGIDFMLQRFNFTRSLRMSHQELREEHKELEGNPMVRGRIKRLQRQMRRKRMLRDVSRATVVVTNPDHFAVALEYNPETTPAPVVLAKGRNLFAQQIKQQARWLGVPIVENPPLARALYQAVEVGQSIPAKLYAAVAEILAFIYRTQARASNRTKPIGDGAR